MCQKQKAPLLCVEWMGALGSIHGDLLLCLDGWIAVQHYFFIDKFQSAGFDYRNKGGRSKKAFRTREFVVFFIGIPPWPSTQRRAQKQKQIWGKWESCLGDLFGH
jgi:hypothetical protein